MYLYINAYMYKVIYRERKRERERERWYVYYVLLLASISITIFGVTANLVIIVCVSSNIFDH